MGPLSSCRCCAQIVLSTLQDQLWLKLSAINSVHSNQISFELPNQFIKSSAVSWILETSKNPEVVAAADAMASLRKLHISSGSTKYIAPTLVMKIFSMSHTI